MLIQLIVLVGGLCKLKTFVRMVCPVSGRYSLTNSWDTPANRCYNFNITYFSRTSRHTVHCVLIRACTVLARTLSSPSFTIQFPTDIERVKLCVLSAERRTPDIQWMVTGWREEDSFSVIMAGSSVKFSVTRALLLSLFISLQLVHVSNFYFLISTHVWQTTVCEVSSYYFPSMNK